MNRKSLVVMVVLLFIGAAITPVIGADFSNKTILSKKQLDLYGDLVFNRLINFSMRLGRIPSLSACIIKNDRVIWSKGYGFYNIEQEKQATCNTNYMIGSLSKFITATALMQLYDQGLFDLDDDVNDYLDFILRNPNYPDVPITYRMLLSHTASLATEPVYYHGVVYGSDPIPLASWIENYFYTNGSVNRNAWRERCPGEEFCYSSIGFCLVGHLVEQISNQSFNEYCKEYIFLPLNMTDTSFLLSEMDLDQMAVPYLLEDGTIYCRFYFPLQYYSWRMYPAGNMITSVMELSHFLIAHMNGGVYNGVRILNESTVELMHRIQTPNKYKGLHYGLGFYIWQNLRGQIAFIGHLGALYGYDSCMKIRLSDGTAIIYFINRNINREFRGKIAHLIIERALFKMADKL